MHGGPSAGPASGLVATPCCFLLAVGPLPQELFLLFVFARVAAGTGRGCNMPWALGPDSQSLNGTMLSSSAADGACADRATEFCNCNTGKFNDLSTDRPYTPRRHTKLLATAFPVHCEDRLTQHALRQLFSLHMDFEKLEFKDVLLI